MFKNSIIDRCQSLARGKLKLHANLVEDRISHLGLFLVRLGFDLSLRRVQIVYLASETRGVPSHHGEQTDDCTSTTEVPILNSLESRVLSSLKFVCASQGLFSLCPSGLHAVGIDLWTLEHVTFDKVDKIKTIDTAMVKLASLK